MLNCEYRRRQRGLRQGDLGRIVRIGQSWISLLEQGRWTPTDDQLTRIAQELGLSPDEVLKPVVATIDLPADATETVR